MYLKLDKTKVDRATHNAKFIEEAKSLDYVFQIHSLAEGYEKNYIKLVSSVTASGYWTYTVKPTDTYCQIKPLVVNDFDDSLFEL